jgi:hypothetical protein
VDSLLLLFLLLVPVLLILLLFFGISCVLNLFVFFRDWLLVLSNFPFFLSAYFFFYFEEREWQSMNIRNLKTREKKEKKKNK